MFVSCDISKVLCETDCYMKIKGTLRLLDIQMLIGLLVPQIDAQLLVIVFYLVAI